MKNAQNSKSPCTETSEMRPEYRLDYSQARPNPFAAEALKGHICVTLDPDVAEIFTSSESVNSALRALIATTPETGRRKKPVEPSDTGNNC